MKLPAFLAVHAAATPRREALVCDGLRLSFIELEQHSSSLAAALNAQGVGLGDRVEAIGAEVVANSPEEFAQFQAKEIAKWARVIKDSGIKPE